MLFRSYVALGIDLTGRKDILGLWISENEGAKFWLNNFTEMKKFTLERNLSPVQHVTDPLRVELI